MSEESVIAAQGTPGQAAYEGMVAHSLSDGGAPGKSAGWDGLEPWQRERWEAAAQAAVAAAQPQPAPGLAALLAAKREELRQAAPEAFAALSGQAAPGPCPGCESLRRQHAETCGEVGILAAALREIKDCYPPGHAGHDIAHTALDRLWSAPARPQPAPGLTLSEHVTVRFPAELEAAAKHLAAAEGMTVSAWIRSKMDQEIARRTAAAEQPAPELAAAMAETRKLRELLGDILGSFSAGSVVGGQTKGDAIACVGRIQFAKWRERAGLSH